LLQTISGLEAENFLDDRKAEEQKKFGPPVLVLTLTGGSQDQNLKFYRPAKKKKEEDGSFYIVSTPAEPIYILKGKGLDTLLQKDLYTLRDKTALNIERMAVREIQVQAGPESFSLFKKDDGWQMDDRKTDADKAKVAKLLDELDLMKVQKFLDDNPKDLSAYGLSEPQRKAAFYDKDKKLLGRLVLGKSQGDLVYAKTDSQPSVVLVKKSILDMIGSKAQFVKKP
jgi:hypothetical protein